MDKYKMLVVVEVEIEAPGEAEAVDWVTENLEGEQVGFEVHDLRIYGISEV